MAFALTQIISAEIDEGVGEVSRLTMQVAAHSVTQTELAAVNELTFHREEEGVIWHGYLQHDATVIDQDDSRVLTIVAEGRECELRFRSTARGIICDQHTPQAALDRLLEDTGWAGALEGTFSVLVSRRFDHLTRLAAVFELAKILQGFVRFDRINRVVTISNEPPDSGLTFERVEVPSTDSQVGIISALREVSNDRSEIYNRIFPYSKIDSHDILDPRGSTRTGPYQIFSRTPSSPNVVAVGSYTGTTDQLNEHLDDFQDTSHAIEFEARGFDRVLVLGFMVGGTSGGGSSVPGTVYLNGQRSLPTAQSAGTVTAGTNRWINVQVIRGIRVGANRVTWSFGGGSGVGYTAVAVCLEGADLTSPLVNTGETGSGTSTTPSVGFPSVPWALALDFVRNVTNASGTPNAGQRELFDNNNAKVSARPGEVDTANMGWTLSTSSAWLQQAIYVRGARNIYLEDEDSIDAYDLREFPLAMGGFTPTSETLSDVMDSMYDAAVEFLIDHKDPRRHWQANVAWIPLKPLDWEVGSTARLRWAVERDPIDEVLVIPKRTQRFDADGSRAWGVEFSTRNKFRAQWYDILASLERRVAAIQGSQV